MKAAKTIFATLPKENAMAPPIKAPMMDDMFKVVPVLKARLAEALQQ